MDKDNQLVHAEMRFGAAEVVIDGEWIDYVASQINLSGKNSQLIYIHLKKEIDAHCAHAKVSGAEIIDGPSDQFYGDRTYRARDIGGHIWTFSQTIKHVPKDEAEK
ncbi:MAG: glyoxalase [Hyphomicrobiales bacterium]